MTDNTQIVKCEICSEQFPIRKFRYHLEKNHSFTTKEYKNILY